VRLVPRDLLATKYEEVDQRIDRLTVRYNLELLDDEVCGRAFRYYLLFTHWPSLIDPEGAALSPADIFYNRYRWFLAFAKLHQAKHGVDAGLEQQAFQLLEDAETEVDWTVIEAIEARVTEDVGSRAL
jgi:hypothetical protein